MRVTVYMRLAEGKRGMRVAASTSPNYEPIYSGQGNWNAKPLPTAAFAIELDVPEALFARAEQVLAEIAIAEDQAEVAAEVKELAAT